MFVPWAAETKIQRRSSLANQLDSSSTRVWRALASSERSYGSRSGFWYRSILLNMRICSLSPAPISNKMFCTAAICSRKEGCDTSTTCRSKSASRTSSRVDLKDSTNCVGSLRMNPTVSESRNFPRAPAMRRTVVSSVAKSLFSARTSLPER